MKNYFLVSLVLPTLLLSDNANEEIAAIIKNDEVYSFEDLRLLKNELLHFSRDLLDHQNHRISTILQDHKEAILQGVKSIGNQNLKAVKKEIGLLASVKIDPSITTSSAPLQADAYEQDDSSDDTDKIAPNNNPAASRRSTRNSQDQIGTYRPSLESHYYYCVLDFLYWTVHEGQQSYLIPNFQTPPSIAGSPFGGDTYQIGTLKEFTYNWAPGYRVAVGYNVTPDYWDLEAQYTYVHPTGSSSATDESPPSLDAIDDGTGGPFFVGTLPQFTGNTMAVATADVALNYNVADLLLSKRIKLSKQILCRFGMGGIGGFLSHHLHVNYFGAEPGLLDKNSLHWKFQGGGFKLALETDWLMGVGLSVLGKFNAGLLYGAYKNRFLNEAFNTSGVVVNDLNPGQTYTVQDALLSTHRFATTVQFALGTSWGMVIYDWLALQVFAGYEFNFWYNVHYMLHSNFESGVSGRETRFANELLGLQGLTLRVQLTF